MIWSYLALWQQLTPESWLRALTALIIVVDAAMAYCPQFVHQMANGATVVGPNH